MIGIKDMTMPKRCAECTFCLKQKTNDYSSFGECLLQEDKKVDCLTWGIDENCPLVAIKNDCEDTISRQTMLDYQEYLRGKMSNEENYEL